MIERKPSSLGARSFRTRSGCTVGSTFAIAPLLWFSVYVFDVAAPHREPGLVGNYLHDLPMQFCSFSAKYGGGVLWLSRHSVCVTIQLRPTYGEP